ncbi:MAG: hypothetical protein SGI88_21150 [Candidatus Hydrogenedentes bacterium]|nr:hypothetical protein [Candidatus Hydrogenedentota bacterium]
MGIITAATIALLLALVAGGTVWILWSVAENIAAKRRKHETAPTDSTDQQS